MGAVFDPLQCDVYYSACDNFYRRLQWDQDLRPDKMEQTQPGNRQNPSRIILHSHGRISFLPSVNTIILLVLLFP